MFVLLVLVLAGAIPVLLLLASLFIRTGASTGGIVAISGGVSVSMLKIILGLIVIGVLAFGIFLHRRGAPLK